MALVFPFRDRLLAEARQWAAEALAWPRPRQASYHIGRRRLLLWVVVAEARGVMAAQSRQKEDIEI